MAQVVTFFDQDGRQIWQGSGKGDLIVAQLFSEFVADVLKDRGLKVKPQITSDDTEAQSRWPNMRLAADQLTKILLQTQPQRT